MICIVNKEELLAYLDGEIDEARRREIEAHLALCSECRQEVEILVQEGSLWQNALKPRSLSSDFCHRTEERLLAMRRRQRVLWWCLSAAAALVFLAAGAALLLRKSPQSGEPASLVTHEATTIQEFNLKDGSRISGSPGSRINVNESNREVSLENAGDLYLKVVKDNKPFRLSTPAGMVVVHGTEFSVKVRKKTDAASRARWALRVTVVCGTVELCMPLGNAVGVAGETLSAEEGMSPVTSPGWW